MSTCILLAVATTVVDQRTRAAFAPECLADLLEQLNEAEYPVTYEYRAQSVCGKTIVGSAHLDGSDLMVKADIAAAWWGDVEFERIMPNLGGGVAGKVLDQAPVDSILVVSKIRLAECTLLQLHSSVNPKKPARKVTA